MTDLVGRIIENYRVEALIGQGGMGIVYRGYDLKLDRPVAIKIMNIQAADLSRFIERFRREAKNQAKLIHPNIVTVYGFIEERGLLGIVMEYVEGEGLDEIIRRQGKLHPYDAVYLIKQVLSGIGYAHSKGYIHRDIKPSNILVNRDGVAKIMDFGISKSLFEKGVTQTGAKVGTVYYMSPEQIRGERVTHHADIYAIGCTFYEMLVGRPPFVYESEYDIMDAHLKKMPPKISQLIPGAPPLLDEIIATALAKNPTERYQHCEQFLQDINKLERELTKIHSQYVKKRGEPPKSKKILNIVYFSAFIAVILLLSWFVYNQVNELFKSRQLDMLKKYSIESLFKSNKYFEGFSSLEKSSTNVKITVNAIKMLDNVHGVAVGDSGYVFETQNGGRDWSIASRVDTAINLHDVFVKSNGDIFIVGDSSRIYFGKSPKNLNVLALNGNYALLDVAFKDELNGFILGNKGLILKSNDGGKSWRNISSSSTELLYEIKFLKGTQIGYIVGKSGTLLKSIDGGDSWNKVKPFTRKYLKSIDFLNDKVGIIVGGGGSIFRTNDGGETWEKSEFKEIRGLNKIRFIKDDMAIVCANKGLLLISNDSGYSWQLFDTKTFINLTDIDVTPNDEIYLSGIMGTILHLK
jgi:serine/threonine-protein kinase